MQPQGAILGTFQGWGAGDGEQLLHLLPRAPVAKSLQAQQAGEALTGEGCRPPSEPQTSPGGLPEANSSGDKGGGTKGPRLSTPALGAGTDQRDLRRDAPDLLKLEADRGAWVSGRWEKGRPLQVTRDCFRWPQTSPEGNAGLGSTCRRLCHLRTR